MGRGAETVYHSEAPPPRRSASGAPADSARAEAASDAIRQIFERSCGVDGMCAQAAVVLGWRLRSLGISRRLVCGYYETRDGRIEDHCYVVCDGGQILDPSFAQFDQKMDPGSYLPPDAATEHEPLPDAASLREVQSYLSETMELVPKKLESLWTALEFSYGG